MEKVFWTQGAEVSQESIAPPKTSSAPVQEAISHQCKRLLARWVLHPLLTTFGNFSCVGQYPSGFPSTVCKREDDAIPKVKGQLVVAAASGRLMVLTPAAKPEHSQHQSQSDVMDKVQAN